VEGTPAFVADGLVVHNTRKSHVDLYSRLIGDPTWTTISDAASVWKEDGEPIWPEMWDKAALLVRKATLDKSDVLAWSQEYLNHPMPHETQMFHPESWPQYADEPHSMAAREDMSVLQYWDLAISEKTTADFTVGICVAVDQDNKMYLLEVRRGHWDFNRTLQEIGSLGASYPKVLRVGIEKVAYQAAAVQEATRRTMLPIVPIEPDKDKVTRARLVEARANVSMVFRPVASEWWADFATETSFFPDVGTHDDQVDALSGVALMAGWNADSIAYAYNVWTCLGCGHMFMWDAGRACPKCGVKAPPTFANPDMAAYGGLLEDMPKDETESQMRSENATVMAPPSAVVAPGPATAPPAAKVAGQPTYEVEVELGDPQYSVSLRHAVEQMGDEVEEREGRYFVATRRPGPIRTALAQLPYVQSVI
jgi:predicted phage terminase large subunit-like protein